MTHRPPPLELPCFHCHEPARQVDGYWFDARRVFDECHLDADKFSDVLTSLEVYAESDDEGAHPSCARNAAIRQAKRTRDAMNGATDDTSL